MVILAAEADVIRYRIQSYILVKKDFLKSQNNLEHGPMDKFGHLKFFVDFL